MGVQYKTKHSVDKTAWDQYDIDEDTQEVWTLRNFFWEQVAQYGKAETETKED